MATEPWQAAVPHWRAAIASAALTAGPLTPKRTAGGGPADAAAPTAAGASAARVMAKARTNSARERAGQARPGVAIPSMGISAPCSWGRPRPRFSCSVHRPRAARDAPPSARLAACPIPDASAADPHRRPLRRTAGEDPDDRVGDPHAPVRAGAAERIEEARPVAPVQADGPVAAVVVLQHAGERRELDHP